MDETFTTRIDDLELAKGLRVEGARRVEFSIDGKRYQIDLADQSMQDFTEALAPFVAQARQVNTKGEPITSRRRKSTDKSARNDAYEIRTWAVRHGHELSDRGRIPSAIRQAYLDHRAAAEVG